MDSYRDRFITAMDDDLNTPQALAVLFDLAKAINRAHDERRAVGEAQALLIELAGVLGLQLERSERSIEAEPFAAFVRRLQVDLAAAELADLEGQVAALLSNGSGDSVPPASIDAVVELRRQLRAAKQWKLADGVRDGLAGIGVQLEDGPQGTAWKIE
jgi:cysteinyl-tRNA synthetase